MNWYSLLGSVGSLDLLVSSRPRVDPVGGLSGFGLAARLRVLRASGWSLGWARGSRASVEERCLEIGI